MNEKILEIKDLMISFDGFKAIKGITTDIYKNKIHFFIGPNGAGKTTLLDAICGRIKPTEGSILYHRKLNIINIVKLPEYKLVNIGIGRKFQVPSVFTNLTVYENMELAVQTDRSVKHSLFKDATSEQNKQIDEVLELVELQDYKDVIAASLSHGQKQWLEIAMLIVQDLDLILLDEPVAGMGRKETTRTGELLKKISQHCTVIVVEHDMQFVREYADCVTVLHEGAILDEGDVEKVHSNPKVIEVYLGRGGDSCA